VFGALRAQLAGEAGVLRTVQALHVAGYEAGVQAASAFTKEAGGDSASLGESRFWAHLAHFFEKRGWGQLAHRDAHPGVGMLSSSDWAESASADEQPDAGCSFSAGFLSGLLSEVAGGPVAVLEVECRMRGHDSCDFAFGAETTIHDLYGHLLEGTELEAALEGL
jgi:hypothetical protein